MFTVWESRGINGMLANAWKDKPQSMKSEKMKVWADVIKSTVPMSLNLETKIECLVFPPSDTTSRSHRSQVLQIHKIMLMKQQRYNCCSLRSFLHLEWETRISTIPEQRNRYMRFSLMLGLISRGTCLMRYLRDRRWSMGPSWTRWAATPSRRRSTRCVDDVLLNIYE